MSCANCINWQKITEKRSGIGLGECMLPADQPKFTAENFSCNEFYQKPAGATPETVVQPGEIIKTHIGYEPKN